MKLYGKLFELIEDFENLLCAVKEGRTPAYLSGLSQVHKAHLYVGMQEQLEKPSLILTSDELAARRICEDINAMAGENSAVLFPARDFTFRSVDSVSKEYEQARISVLSKILAGECTFVIASIEAAMQHTIPKEILQERSVVLSQAQEIGMEEIISILIRAGYVRRPQVEGIAQFSVRGGILDFYPPDYAAPVRMEFWGDEIDTISLFDLETQRRTDSVDEVHITPASEVLIESNDSMIEKITALSKKLRGKNAPAVREHLQKDLDRLQSDLEIQGIDRYLPLVYEKPSTIFDYLPDAQLFISEYTEIKEAARAYIWQLSEDIKSLFEEGVLCKGLDTFTCTFADVQSICEHRGAVFTDTFAHTVDSIPIRSVFSTNAIQLSTWGGEVSLLVDDLKSFLARGYCCVVLAGTRRAAQALVTDLQKQGLPADFVEDLKNIVLRRVFVLEGTLSSGFEYPEAHFALISHQRTGSNKTKKRRAKKAGEIINSITDLTPGDLVVHVSHGIGVFSGIHKLDLHGVVKDYIKIRYAGEDTLYVPVTQLDLVSKYVGARDDKTVKLNKLNSAEWNKTRQRVKKAVADMADELIKLYAERAQAKGYAFSEDTDWQRDFEERFPYEETDDQLRCIEEITSDMERPHPMDRLLCGDVGFGKTEVALRAAFKCVMDSKQVAILVPTTILAFQHYQTMLRRFEGFPINIELLSRFRTKQQQEAIIRKLRRGEVDIVVGTHRLIQKDVQFKDLGLAIIDEEQRFGVAHKERFKELFKGIDVLTLSATPIPRTLNMAMSGIRDMSVIEEAPSDRHPVQTYVIEQDMGLIGEAIKRELRRGGQIYYLHNRIETIDQCAARIAEVVPEARIVTAHGKMGEEQMSEVWRRLMDHEIDVLVCTTIIETGVDVPNCNTLIIEDADNMGLSQLYQLRGRVGRSNRRAFAYLTFRPGKSLTDIATKRLSAIREFTKFGSGFRIAMRDLEIRGAGNILGAQQHGHMESVGYDMYLRLLAEAISERKGEKVVKQEDECLIDIRIGAHIPERYISDLSQRIDVYRKIASVKTEEDSMDVFDELIDRFGEPPQSVKGLVDVALLRNIASSLSIYEISERSDTLILYPRTLDMNAVGALVQELKPRVMVNAGAKPYLSIKLKKGDDTLEILRKALTTMQHAGESTAD